MDPKDKEIAALKASVATLTAAVATKDTEIVTVSKERDQFKTDNKKLGKDIEDKDQLIEQKNRDIVGVRKKLSDMTQKEKDELSEAEKTALQRGEENESRLAKLEADRKADLQRERDSRVEAEIGRYTNKPELQAKIRENLGRLADFGKSQTVQEIAAAVKTGIDMLGTLTPGTLNTVINAPGSDAPGDSNKKTDFADTPEGQALLGRVAPQAVTPPAAKA